MVDQLPMETQRALRYLNCPVHQVEEAQKERQPFLLSAAKLLVDNRSVWRCLSSKLHPKELEVRRPRQLQPLLRPIESSAFRLSFLRCRWYQNRCTQYNLVAARKLLRLWRLP